jgi:hypothetical protein
MMRGHAAATPRIEPSPGAEEQLALDYARSILGTVVRAVPVMLPAIEELSVADILDVRLGPRPAASPFERAGQGASSLRSRRGLFAVGLAAERPVCLHPPLHAASPPSRDPDSCQPPTSRCASKPVTHVEAIGAPPSPGRRLEIVEASHSLAFDAMTLRRC